MTVFTCMHAQSCPTLCDPWTVAHQAPLCMGFFRQENWSGLPFPIPGYLPVPGIEPVSCMVLYIPSSQTDYIMVFYLQSLLLFAFLHLFIASSNRGGLSHTQSIQSAVISREWVGFTLAWVLSTTDTWCNSQWTVRTFRLSDAKGKCTTHQGGSRLPGVTELYLFLPHAKCMEVSS